MSPPSHSLHEYPHLAQAYQACLQCFDRLEIGAIPPDALASCTIRLKVARLRLARWGLSTGLQGGPNQRSIAVPAGDLTRIEHQLESITRLFGEVEKQSQSDLQDKPFDKSHATLVLEPQIRGLHSILSDISDNRAPRDFKSGGALSSPTWQISRAKRVDRLLEDFCESMDALVSAVPQAKVIEARIAMEDVSKIQNSTHLRMLHNIMKADDDDVLRAAVADKMKATGSVYNDLQATENSRIHAGDDVAYGLYGRSHVYNGVHTSGHAFGHLGNVYRPQQ